MKYDQDVYQWSTKCSYWSRPLGGRFRWLTWSLHRAIKRMYEPLTVEYTHIRNMYVERALYKHPAFRILIYNQPNWLMHTWVEFSIKKKNNIYVSLPFEDLFCFTFQHTRNALIILPVDETQSAFCKLKSYLSKESSKVTEELKTCYVLSRIWRCLWHQRCCLWASNALNGCGACRHKTYCGGGFCSCFVFLLILLMPAPETGFLTLM